MHTEHTYAPQTYIYIHIYMAGHSDPRQTCWALTPTLTTSSCSLIRLSRTKVHYWEYICMPKVDPTSSWTQKLSLSNSYPWTYEPQGCSPSPAAGAATRSQSSPGLPWSLQPPRCALTPTDTQLLSYPEVALRALQAPPGPQPTSWPLLVIRPTLAPAATPQTHTSPSTQRAKGPLQENSWRWSLVRRQDRPCWSGAGHCQTSVLASPAQSPEALALHSLMCPTPQSSNPP